MKWIKKILLALVCLPALLIISFILFELFGMCVNHIATARQTDRIKKILAKEFTDAEILDIVSETGNTSGTGNHVDCLSRITFSTSRPQSEIEEILYRHFSYNEWTCFVRENEDGNYVFYLNTSAPFRDNIEGH